ncbi:DUF4169 family protein [Pseudorhodobacter ferrugineus]|uniref:DUF4169 family protein n=1 Tax=Pseudorhodobacter ferrugineus TaxID=77008 RepID=UPI0003B506EE|nr:DUF4169 family protein [Pseudorhodobacter ferrugineus]
MAAEIINLRAAKKARSKAEARAQADANATKFGRTKAERTLDQSRANKARHSLDLHKREPDDEKSDSENPHGDPTK